MIGIKRLNADRTLFVREGGLILKADGNKSQKGREPNDWFLGAVGDSTIASWGKYQGGDKENPDNYDMDSSINRDAFPDV
jgi:hypothetical protein